MRREEIQRRLEDARADLAAANQKWLEEPSQANQAEAIEAAAAVRRLKSRLRKVSNK